MNNIHQGLLHTMNNSPFRPTCFPEEYSTKWDSMSKRSQVYTYITYSVVFLKPK